MRILLAGLGTIGAAMFGKFIQPMPIVERGIIIKTVEATPPPKEHKTQNKKQLLTSFLQSVAGSGLSPKDYGQRLQALGKQKWTKSKRKK